MFLAGTDRQGAFDWLGQTFHIAPRNNTEYEIRNELTNAQYACIGIQGDLATKNFDFDLEKYSLESAQKFADKYRMTVNELRTKYPNVYTHKILMAKALPYVSELRNNYYMRLYNYHILAKAMGVKDPMQILGASRKEFEGLKDELARADKLLYKAAKGTSLEERLTTHKYDVQQDYEDIVNGKIPFEIGPVSYFVIKQQARLNDEVVHYRSVAADDYAKLEKIMAEIPHAAFVKGSQVNLCFLQDMSLTIEQCLKALPVKDSVEKAVAEAVSKSEAGENKAKEPQRKAPVYQEQR